MPFVLKVFDCRSRGNALVYLPLMIEATSAGVAILLNILVTRNRKSVNLGIRVPVPGNHLFVLDYSFYFYGNICQGLAASAVRSSLYKYPCRNYDSVCTKVNLKSDFHIAGQLMETHPEYSIKAFVKLALKNREIINDLEFDIIRR